MAGVVLLAACSKDQPLVDETAVEQTSSKQLEIVIDGEVNTLKFRIARAHSLGGPAYTINASSGRYFNRHLLRNQCITGGIDFDNEISSFRVYQGGTVEFHEDPD